MVAISRETAKQSPEQLQKDKKRRTSLPAQLLQIILAPYLKCSLILTSLLGESTNVALLEEE